MARFADHLRTSAFRLSLLYGGVFQNFLRDQLGGLVGATTSVNPRVLAGNYAGEQASVAANSSAGGNWLYQYQDHNGADNRPRLQALALSHEPSPWMGDRQTLQLMPEAQASGVPLLDRAARSQSAVDRPTTRARSVAPGDRRVRAVWPRRPTNPDSRRAIHARLEGRW